MAGMVVIHSYVKLYMYIGLISITILINYMYLMVGNFLLRNQYNIRL